MKSMILAAFAALSLSAGAATMALAAPTSAGQTSTQQSNDNGPSLMGGGG
jgi:hypothetical protein